MKSRRKRRQLTPGWRGSECGWVWWSDGGRDERDGDKRQQHFSRLPSATHDGRQNGHRPDKHRLSFWPRIPNTGREHGGAGRHRPHTGNNMPARCRPAGHTVRVTCSSVNGVEKVKKGGVVLVPVTTNQGNFPSERTSPGTRCQPEKREVQWFSSPCFCIYPLIVS